MEQRLARVVNATMTAPNEPRLVRTRWGFFQYDPLPTEQELRAFYAEQYYQEGHGSYEVHYDDEEVRWRKLRAWLVYRKSVALRGERSSGTICDVGCGEGWILDVFHAHGWIVRGMDFSAYAIQRFHPHLTSFFVQGNIFDLLEQYIRDRQRSDVFTLMNVIEHVRDPVGLLDQLHALMNERALLIINAPNDYSPLHEHLLAQRLIDRPFWLAHPHHLSYFNRESMTALLEDRGYVVEAVVADHPIDLNLLNEHTNYVADPDKGKGIHRSRIRTDNFLASIDRDALLHLYEAYGAMGVGRNLTYYCRKRVG